jgi:hypothetical protein
MNRYTFVIQIHPDGLSTLENLSTSERVRISDLSSVGPQIESWLRSLGGDGPGGAQPASSDGDGAPIIPEPAPRPDDREGIQ